MCTTIKELGPPNHNRDDLSVHKFHIGSVYGPSGQMKDSLVSYLEVHG